MHSYRMRTFGFTFSRSIFDSNLKVKFVTLKLSVTKNIRDVLHPTCHDIAIDFNKILIKDQLHHARRHRPDFKIVDTSVA